MGHVSIVRYAWATLVFNVIVILTGAVVRATGSGAGCGRSWPTCQGEVTPKLEGATAVEFAHRAMSGAALILVIVLVIWTWRSVEPGRAARRGALLSLVAIVAEALIGAVIVLFEWVADDASIARAVSVPLHLVNTFLLLAGLTLTAYWLDGGEPIDRRANPSTWRWVMAGAVSLLLLSATGAITALADTLFPKSGEASSTVNTFLTDLRIVHPVLAVGLVLAAWWAVSRRGIGGTEVRWMAVIVGAQLATGVLNISLGVPVWMQILHLALADLLWVNFVLVSARLLAVGASATEPKTVIRG